MNKKCLPHNYKPNALKQHGMSIEEYIKEFKQLMMKCEVLEVQEQTIARFLGEMNQGNADLVELQLFWFFEDVCKLAIEGRETIEER